MPRQIKKQPAPSNEAQTAPKWEEYLRRGVLVVGNKLEHLIGKAEKMGKSFGQPSTSTQPVLSLEGQLPLMRLKDLINSVAEKVIAPSIPSLVDKTALEIREGPTAFASKFKERGASIAVHVDISTTAGSYDRPERGVASIRSVPSRLPFEDGFFDHIVGLYSSQYQGDLSKALKEFSRLLTISGEGVIVDFHPFGMYAKRGVTRLRPVESTAKGLEDYYKLCKMAGLKITNIKESLLDESVRSLFVSEEEKSSFRIIKDSPLLIYLFVRKGG